MTSIKNLEYANRLISEIYDEGDRDIIFFGQLLLYVSVDLNEKYFDKTPERRLADAIKLTGYLVSTGDFNVGRCTKQPDGRICYQLFPGGISEFDSFVRHQFQVGGIEDVNLHFTTWIQKRLPAKSPTLVPVEIAKALGD